MNNDKGHDDLIFDLEALLAEARAYVFHDFANQMYAAPKMELAARFKGLRQNVIDGIYDNEPPK